MPELPDVEVFCKDLKSTSLRKPIKSVPTLDKTILWKTSPQKFRSVLKGNQIRVCRRHGKYLFAELKGDGSLGMHFGMTGRLKYLKEGEKPPAPARIVVEFEDGHCLAYTSVRKLGRVFLVTDIATFVRKRQLGPDALGVDFDTFHSIFRSRRGAVKATLMDQALLAGLGNIYTDEILFQAGIRPTRTCDRVSSKEWQRVFRLMRKVLPAAISKRAQRDRLPNSYLTPHRKTGAKCPRCGSPLKNSTVGGRTTYFCPREQK
ncbi:MAG TPA: DNA-formamidopyrimidine glycosylase family protein [Terriglobia bacterium]|nr:DNA-formamidopyrimidine glycosylase family protein [Terriglobia bacterium]